MKISYVYYSIYKHRHTHTHTPDNTPFSVRLLCTHADETVHNQNVGVLLYRNEYPRAQHLSVTPTPRIHDRTLTKPLIIERNKICIEPVQEAHIEPFLRWQERHGLGRRRLVGGARLGGRLRRAAQRSLGLGGGGFGGSSKGKLKGSMIGLIGLLQGIHCRVPFRAPR